MVNSITDCSRIKANVGILLMQDITFLWHLWSTIYAGHVLRRKSFVQDLLKLFLVDSLTSPSGRLSQSGSACRSCCTHDIWLYNYQSCLEFLRAVWELRFSLLACTASTSEFVSAEGISLIWPDCYGATCCLDAAPGSISLILDWMLSSSLFIAIISMSVGVDDLNKALSFSVADRQRWVISETTSSSGEVNAHSLALALTHIVNSSLFLRYVGELESMNVAKRIWCW